MNEKGQSIFEFIIFLPFMIFLLTVIISVGNSINGSINQQKAVRRYFFYIYKGNSTIPTATDLSFFARQGLQQVGVSSVGWREKAGSSGETSSSFGTCYPFNTLFSENKDDECDAPALVDNKSNFVRLFTFFGICGETYQKAEGDYFLPNYSARSLPSSCTIQ